MAANEAAVVVRPVGAEVTEGFTTKLLDPLLIALADVKTRLPKKMNAN